MQKSHFFITIFTAIMTTSTMCMELTSDTTEIPKFIVTLHLKEVGQEDIGLPYNKTFDGFDKHACEVLGIKWEENNNKYWVNHALFRKYPDTQDINWSQSLHPKGLPRTTMANPHLEGNEQYTYQRPTSFPAHFVERFKDEDTIILKDCFFEKPVEIHMKLASMTRIPSPYNFTKYIASGVTVVAVIALIIYLYQNNHLPL